MEVILSQRVPKLGNEGDVVKVKSGYARNYLLPRKFAYLATPSNLKRMELQKAKQAEIYVSEKKAAEALAAKLEKVSCTITVEVNDLEKMYGSVSDLDIVKALADEGIEIDRKAVLLEQPIDALGIYEVNIKLHLEVMAKVRVWVAKK
ncbi:MAG: 50S ribosomal protein L9 [Candidatus Omnitrophota bacterium]